MRNNPITPDYIKVGSTVVYVTWTKILILFASVLALQSVRNSLFFQSSSNDFDRIGGAASPSPLFPKRSSIAAGKPSEKKSGVRGLIANVISRASGGGSLQQGQPQPTALPQFCAPHASTYYFDLWQLSFLGSSKDFPSSELVQKKGEEGGEVGRRPKIAESLCEWVDRTATDVSFSMCTFDTSIDVQISLYLHKEKLWNSWKKGLMEDLLPRISSVDVEARTLEGRTVVIDVGANLGFFSLLAAKRGYDVLAFEPAKEALLRLLISAVDNDIQVAKSMSDRADGFGSLGVGAQPEGSNGRKPILYAFLNAVHDAYSSATLDYVQDNPGASWISSVSTPPSGANPSQRSVSTVFIDDIVYVRDPAAEKAQEALQHKLKKKSGGGGGGGGGEKKSNSGASRIQKQAAAAGIALASKKPSASSVSVSGVESAKNGNGGVDESSASADSKSNVPSLPGKAGLLLHPSKVRLVKISAEGMDSRVLNGMRRLLAVGRIPFVLFVYNSAHVKNAGCDNEKLVHAMINWGYQLWHGGTFFKRPVDVDRFIKGMTGRSIELLFVGPDTQWY